MNLQTARELGMKLKNRKDSFEYLFRSRYYFMLFNVTLTGTTGVPRSLPHFTSESTGLLVWTGF